MVPPIADAFRGAEKQQSIGPQGIVEKRKQPLLQWGIKIDQQVPAGDEIQAGERGILADILRCESDEIANRFAKSVMAFLRGEKSLEPLGRHVRRHSLRINAGPGHFDGRGIQVCGEHLKTETLVQFLRAFPQQNREGVGLLSGRAARNPDAHGGILGPRLEQIQERSLGQHGKGRGIPKETGDADQQFLEQEIQFVRVGLQNGEILPWAPNLM